MGNACSATRISRRIPVHPHGCGERVDEGLDWGAEDGSSPRLWGTLKVTDPQTQASRFIPTAVGNAIGRSRPVLLRSVHPHGCGERWQTINPSSIVAGSSPRLWGTRCHARPAKRGLRFIPTAVGNAPVSTIWWTTITVHPHGCGERICFAVVIFPYIGSSPRLWGTLSSTTPLG